MDRCRSSTIGPQLADPFTQTASRYVGSTVPDEGTTPQGPSAKPNGLFASPASAAVGGAHCASCEILHFDPTGDDGNSSHPHLFARWIQIPVFQRPACWADDCLTRSPLCFQRASLRATQLSLTSGPACLSETPVFYDRRLG